MEENILTIKKMKYLKRLGIDISDASLFWECYPNDRGYYDYSGYHDTDVQDDASIVSVKAYKDATYFPAYTLQEVLAKLPRSIVVTEQQSEKEEYIGENFLRIGVPTLIEENIIHIEYTKDFSMNGAWAVFKGETLLDSAYMALCWCIENGYIKTKKKKNER